MSPSIPEFLSPEILREKGKNGNKTLYTEYEVREYADLNKVSQIADPRKRMRALMELHDKYTQAISGLDRMSQQIFLQLLEQTDEIIGKTYSQIEETKMNTGGRQKMKASLPNPQKEHTGVNPTTPRNPTDRWKGREVPTIKLTE